METVQPKTKTHPLFIAAAGSLIVVSALGSAAIMGWLPRGGADTGANITTAPAAAAATAPAVPAVPVAEKPVTAARPRVIARAEPLPLPRNEHAPATHAGPLPIAADQAPVHQRETPRGEENRSVLAQAPACRDCGVIESVNEIEKDGEGSGLGAVAGGVVGAIAGKQVGGGRGRNVMSVVGALGGAYAGHQIEKNARKVKSYDITVRFEDGTTRTVSQPTPPAWRAGDRVRFINGMIQPNA